MAKAANSTPFNPTSSNSVLDFDWSDDLPTSTRGGGGAKASETFSAIKSLPAPRTLDGKTQFARRWFPLIDRASDSITDPAERTKAEKENMRKLTNKLSGITSRLTKQDGTAVYTLRSIDQNGNPGVAVYRINAPVTPAVQAAPDGQTV